jgi:hypothetical protein
VAKCWFKWAYYPTGDQNSAKVRGGFPSLAFQFHCITDYNCAILAIFGPQFGSWIDEDIVKTDENMKMIQTTFFKDVMWKYYDVNGLV